MKIKERKIKLSYIKEPANLILLEKVFTDEFLSIKDELP